MVFATGEEGRVEAIEMSDVIREEGASLQSGPAELILITWSAPPFLMCGPHVNAACPQATNQLLIHGVFVEV